MKKSALTILFSTALLFLLSCSIVSRGETASSESRSVYIPEIPSLKENLPTFFQLAREWKPDAYLYRVWFHFEGTTSPWIITDFRSDTNRKESYSIYLEKDGQITSQIYTYEAENNYQTPILDDEWLIDSTEAIQLFAENPEIQEYFNNFDSYDICSGLWLERNANFPDRLLVWRLTIMDCVGFGEDFFMDPMTGEEIPDP